jgi:hypothetical protein
MYSATKAINLHVKNIPHDIRAAFEERAARALVYHGGNNVVRKYETHYDGDCGEWGMLVAKAKQDLQGHFDAEVIHRARFEIRTP